ncbi:hypothetical protein C8F04DRAFT_1266760 [Mycena alexandri]|uniref:Uncharacterized protein n=1 Tax=Mycena alexandri TaxID=1745969 RepID=A0AAD6SIJ8_9AGAR|nr:hypothetical protein C8F04DRAFT_1266760 [Mycena alexandri]
MAKRKSTNSTPPPSTSASTITTVDASSLKAPWAFFWPRQCFTNIIQFFDLENIQDSTSATVMPILNTMWPLMAQFYKKHSNWSLEVAAYLAAVSVASRKLVRKHLGKQHIDEYSDLYWDYPDELEGNLQDAKIPFPDDSFVLPRITIKSKAPLSLSRIDDDSDNADDDNGGNSGSEDNDNADEAPPTKKPRLSTTKGRAASVESVTPSASAKTTRAKGKYVHGLLVVAQPHTVDGVKYLSLSMALNLKLWADT